MEIIAILRGIHPEEVCSHADALVEQGIKTIEVPLNSPKAFDSIELLSNRYPGEVQIGAGTVTTEADVQRVLDAGGTIIVSPNANPTVIKSSKKLGLRALPGVMTPTDCFAALEAGADGLKLFPAELLGPGGLKALSAVLPVGTPLFAVGGVSPTTLHEWTDAGVAGVGLGSALYRAGQSVQTTIENAKAFAAQIR